jgi:hypothetical protein
LNATAVPGAFKSADHRSPSVKIGDAPLRILRHKRFSELS